MNTVSENLLSLIQEHELSYSELSLMTGIPKSALQRYATGRTRKIPYDRVRLIAEAVGVDPAVLTGGGRHAVPREQIPLFSSKDRIPLLGTIACGSPILAEENIVRMVALPDGMDADFCLQCKGDSMIGARICDGDLVFIRSQSGTDNGQIAAVVIGDEATLKRVYYYPQRNKLVLQAENSRCEPMVFEGEELEQIRIVGVAVGFLSRLP